MQRECKEHKGAVILFETDICPICLEQLRISEELLAVIKRIGV